ncbi:MAG: HAD family phosphatase [Nocardioidaceae bacterium]|nr:HAD family phosphatase [Nocardioidaceae bacterium]
MADLPRLVATDLDGTLLASDGSVSERTRDVLSALAARSVRVVLVTARPLRWMTRLWPLVDHQGLAILSNGAVVWDVGRQAPVRVDGIGPDPGLGITDRVRTAAPGVSFALEFLTGPRAEASYEAHADDLGLVDYVRGDLADLWDGPALKILARLEDGDPAGFRRAVFDAVGTDAVPTWTMDGLMEISAVGVTKAAALTRFAADLGIEASEVVAFGDMPNDIPMLTWAGRGFAVGNAHPSVLACADEVTPTNDEDGVAHTLARLFGL